MMCLNLFQSYFLLTFAGIGIVQFTIFMVKFISIINNRLETETK